MIAEQVGETVLLGLFQGIQSLRGLSHAKEEDTKEEHLTLCVQALDRLASKTIPWILAR